MTRILTAVVAALLLLAASAYPQTRPGPATPGAVHSRESLPTTPPELSKFEGVLYGRVEAIRSSPFFTGVYLRLALVHPAGGEPVALQKLVDRVIPVAIPLDRDGKPQPAELGRALRALWPHETIWADVHAADSNHLLYARHLGPTGAEPTRAPTIATADTSAPASSAANLHRMEGELRAMRRDLAHLQQDVATLRLRTQDIERRSPLHR